MGSIYFPCVCHTPGLQEPIATEPNEVFVKMDAVANSLKGSKDVDDLQEGHDELKAFHKTFATGLVKQASPRCCASSNLQI